MEDVDVIDLTLQDQDEQSEQQLVVQAHPNPKKRKADQATIQALHKPAKRVRAKCDICDELVSSKVTCSCDAEMCRTCVRAYLLSVEHRGCPNPGCTHNWSLEFVAKQCGRTWAFDVFRKHVQSVKIKQAAALGPQDASCVADYVHALSNAVKYRQLQKKSYEACRNARRRIICLEVARLDQHLSIRKASNAHRQACKKLHATNDLRKTS